MTTELEKVLNRGNGGSKGKSILIINTPAFCKDCPIYDFEYGQCQMTERYCGDEGAKTEGCPLQTVHEYHVCKNGWVRDDDA